MDDCVIAALGASAGGIEAFERFFTHMPADTGIAFVVVQHIAPDFESALPHIISRHTQMAVEQAVDNAVVLPNRVYVIPPNATLEIDAGVLKISKPLEPRGHRTPIDTCFRSLAEDRGEKAVCIILSGTGTDGTLGLRAIKEHGGLAIAQTTESAQYDAILRSAIATGLVDHVLPIEEMPGTLVEYANYLNSLNGKPRNFRRELAPLLPKVHNLLRRHAGHDFRQYKESTIMRRIQRRMKVAQVESVDEYIQFLERTPNEVDQLFKDLLIGVTQFFRDSAAFEALRQNVIPKLFEGKEADSQIRACVVGCASGEEAYSVAILLHEYALTRSSAAPKIKIFATDIDERGLEMARKGRYPQSVSEQMSPERLERYFVKQGDAYQANREIREMCIFSSHSFIKDPPFSRLDLISCRNVMIYLGLDLQRKVIPIFHYALRPGGYLFLGPAENVNSQRDLFRTIDKTHRIFQKKGAFPRPAFEFPLSDVKRPRYIGDGETGEKTREVPKQIDRIISQHYGPPCVVVKASGEAIYFSGRVGRYLEQPPGAPENNILSMAREGLRSALRTALHRAITTGQRAAQKRVDVRVNGGVVHVDLIVEPLAGNPESDVYIVLVEELPAQAGKEADRVPADDGAEETIRYLEHELHAAQEHLQATAEELETSNEELRSANEEYQSTNEELETSKEELQSFNEELETVNSELNRKVAELDQANSDLQNLLDATQIATIFLDSDLRIKNFTPASESIFRIIPSDIGRPITDLAAQFSEDHLTHDIKEVLRTLAIKERQLTAVHGRSYLMRILPYRTVQNVISGVVLTFVDVTQLKEVELEAQKAKTYAESIVQTVRNPLLVLDADLRVVSANSMFYSTFHLPPEETTGRRFETLGNGEWNIPELRDKIAGLLSNDTALEDFEVRRDFRTIGRRVVTVSAGRIQGQEPAQILLNIQDVTSQKQAEDMLRAANADLKYFSYAASHDLREPLRMVMSYTQLLQRKYQGMADPEVNQYTSYAVESAARIDSLLKGLNEYWAVNEQHLEERVQVDSKAALDKAIGNLETNIRETGAVITHDELPVIKAAETPLILVFQNLISNAIKYRRPDVPPQIHISAANEGNQWKFSVADNGIGIEQEHLKSIFAPFKRLHAREYAGSGIGLAICQRLLERYGGVIWATSNVGEGSTFYFTTSS
jgi:two-component system, chemotaxis family, CheB/CheR fusion protein